MIRENAHLFSPYGKERFANGDGAQGVYVGKKASKREHLALHGYLDALAPRAQSSRVNAGTNARLSNANVATNRTISMAGSPVCLLRAKLVRANLAESEAGKRDSDAKYFV